jgi:tetratricopeptide (TPR) repeat protein
MSNWKAIAAILFLTTVASAKPADDPRTVEAKQHYQSGLAHYNLQEFKAAIEEFEAAYRLIPDPVFLYNLGQAHRLSDNPERALYFYRAYLHTNPTASNRREVEGRVASLEKVLADRKSATPPEQTLTPPPVPSPEKPAEPKVEPRVEPKVEPAPVVASAPPEKHAKPIYKKWWLWTLVGVVAAGAAVGIAVGVTSQSGPTFNAGLGTVGPGALQVGF